MKEILLKAYAYVNGNKTIIASTAWSVFGLMVGNGMIHLSAGTIEVINYCFGLATGGALVDHARKGYFTSEKGK